MKFLWALWTGGSIGCSFTVSASDVVKCLWDVRGVRGSWSGLRQPAVWCATKFPFTKSPFTPFKCADTSQGMEMGFQWNLVVRTGELCWPGFHMSSVSKARKVKRAEGC